MKNFITYLIVSILMISLLPPGIISIPVRAAVEGDYTYEITDGKATLTDYSGVGGDIIIPSTLGDYPVITIGNNVFYDRNDLTRVTIPDTVTRIEDFAFYGCSNLTDIAIPNSVTTIGNFSFCNCSNLISVTIGDLVNSIGDYGFSGCSNLTSVTIGNSVNFFGASVFQLCTSLTKFHVSEGNMAYCSADGILFNKDKSILIQYPIGRSQTNYVIPDSVIIIKSSAFSDCSSIISITIPDSVTEIGDYAFANCSSLSFINIPDSVTYLGGSVCANCVSLASIHLPNTITYIPGGGFRNCDSLTSIEIPDSVISIDGMAFSECDGLTSVVIPNSVTFLGSSAFGMCSNLTDVTIGNFVTYPEPTPAVVSYPFCYANIKILRFYSTAQMERIKAWYSSASYYYDYPDYQFVCCCKDEHHTDNDCNSICETCDTLLAPAKIDETYYNNLEEALSAAVAGQTVTLNADVVATGACTTLGADITLNLNGHNLTVSNFITFGDVVDTSEGEGKLVISDDPTKAFTNLQANNSQMPLYDEDGYRFFSYSVVNRGTRLVDGGKTMQFGTHVQLSNRKAYELLATEKNGNTAITCSITYRGTTFDYTFRPDILAEFGQAVCEKFDKGVADKTGTIMVLSITGYEPVEGKPEIGMMVDYHSTHTLVHKQQSIH